ncbi:family 43 glycosylhydrolase [Sphingomonas sp. MMS24-JH45]
MSGTSADGAAVDILPVAPLGKRPGDGSFVNPILPADYSDPDVIRLGSTYYAISSTLHMSPAMVILRSDDMVNWTTIGHAVPDFAHAGEDVTWCWMGMYGCGMWRRDPPPRRALPYLFRHARQRPVRHDGHRGCSVTMAVPACFCQERASTTRCPFWDDDWQRLAGDDPLCCRPGQRPQLRHQPVSDEPGRIAAGLSARPFRSSIRTDRRRE